MFKFNPLTGNLDLVNPKLTFTNYTGINCSNPTTDSGERNRTLTANATMIVVDNQFLHPTVDYSTSSGVITFLNEIWNDQPITIWN